MAYIVEHSPYSLQPIKSLNAFTTKMEVTGSLLRFHFDDLGTGYSLLQTWPHLGDPTLEVALKDLPKSVIEIARKDAHARSKSLSLNSHVKIKNYWSLGELSEISRIPNDFDTIKWKWPKDKKLIEENMEVLKQYRSRVDFNFQKVESIETLQGLNIDYIEDPHPQMQHSYQIAWDMEKPQIQNNVFVFKPVKDFVLLKEFVPRKKVVFTSNMDHPLGQAIALMEAKSFYHKYPQSQDLCGLITHPLFEKNEYSELLSIEDAELKTNDDIGYGFTQLLEKENWVIL